VDVESALPGGGKWLAGRCGAHGEWRKARAGKRVSFGVTQVPGQGAVGQAAFPGLLPHPWGVLAQTNRTRRDGCRPLHPGYGRSEQHGDVLHTAMPGEWRAR